MKQGDVVRVKGIPGPVMRVCSVFSDEEATTRWFLTSGEATGGSFLVADLEPADAGHGGQRSEKWRRAVSGLLAGAARIAARGESQQFWRDYWTSALQCLERIDD